MGTYNNKIEKFALKDMTEDIKTIITKKFVQELTSCEELVKTGMDESTRRKLIRYDKGIEKGTRIYNNVKKDLLVNELPLKIKNASERLAVLELLESNIDIINEKVDEVADLVADNNVKEIPGLLTTRSLEYIRMIHDLIPNNYAEKSYITYIDIIGKVADILYRQSIEEAVTRAIKDNTQEKEDLDQIESRINALESKKSQLLNEVNSINEQIASLRKQKILVYTKNKKEI